MPPRAVKPRSTAIQCPEASPLKKWIVLGIDPSLSRTGVAVLHVNGDDTRWGFVGSLAPVETSDLMWKRSKAISKGVLTCLNDEVQASTSHGTVLGLIVAVEMAFPTGNGINLIALNRVLMSHLLIPSLKNVFSEIRVLSVLPQTLRSLMGLPKDSKDKKANIERAYEILPREEHPHLDSDACDAVMMAMLGRCAAYVLAGQPERLPDKILTSFCSAKPQARSAAGKIKKTMGLAGLLHWEDYWAEYNPSEIPLTLKSSKVKKGERRGILV